MNKIYKSILSINNYLNIKKILILKCYNYPYNNTYNFKGFKMVAYTQNELASSTDISKQFGHYLSNVSNGIVEKLAILKK